MNSPTVHVFSTPFKTVNGTITQVPVRELTRKDSKQAARYSKDEQEQQDFMMHLATGLQVEDIDSMGLGEYIALTQRFLAVNQLGGGLLSGGRPDIAADLADPAQRD